MRKGCLKHSPPQTPELSHSPWTTPSASGRTSPTPSQCAGPFTRPSLRKNVSFCEDSTLEEVFFADEWDRSPAPVTPKLSYSDVLELKQLFVSLPRAPPPPPTPRQPFTTSLPRDCHTPYEHSCSYPYPSSSSSSSSSSAASSYTPQPFPCSRFALQPSQTPDRWKNRSQFARPIDPEILPYLEAVPIRLLPLLDSSAQEPEPEPSIPPPSPTPASVPETPKVSSLEPGPIAACIHADQHHERDHQPSPSLGPDSNSTVTTSSRSGEVSPVPSPLPSSPPYPPPPSSSSSMPSSQATTPPPPSSQSPRTPPSITLNSPSGTQRSPAVPPSPSPSPSPSISSLFPSPSKPHAPLPPPPRRMSMGFVPLLPAQDASKPVASRREEGKEERRPKRQMNFAFVPLMEKQEEDKHLEEGIKEKEKEGVREDAEPMPLCSLAPAEKVELTPTGAEDHIFHDTAFEHDSEQDAQSEQELESSTPSLSSASDTDNDNDTDGEQESVADGSSASSGRGGSREKQAEYFAPRRACVALTRMVGMQGGAGDGRKVMLAALPSTPLVPPSPFVLDASGEVVVVDGGRVRN